MYNSIPQRIKKISEEFPYNPICYTKNNDNNYEDISYSHFMNEVYRTAYFLNKQCKITKGTRIGIISENRKEWLEYDIAILSLRAIDVPRGTDTNIEDISFILEHSAVKGVIFEKSSTYQALLKYNPKLCKKFSFVIFFDSPTQKFYKQIKVTKTTKNIKKDNTYFYTHADISQIRLSVKEIDTIEKKISSVELDDIATIIYTSGTTQNPKGVCLSHRNFLFQIDRLCPKILSIGCNTRLLTILPIWHIFERIANYIISCKGGTLAYSKPIGAIFLEDIKKINPTHLTSVPRIWESIYSSIQKKVKKSPLIKRAIFSLATLIGKAFNYVQHLKNNTIPTFKPRTLFFDTLIGTPLFLLLYLPYKLFDILAFKKIRNLLGTHFLAGISGGGTLTHTIDQFFQVIGIKVLNGYGLTETSPVISVRNEYTPEMSGVGKFLQDILYKVVDNNGNIVPVGNKGILYIKSKQVMKEYYKNKKASATVLSKDGWFNTGDLVRVSEEGDLDIIGRIKDTIVLSNGKNIEPEPIENILNQSDYIDTAMVIGQDSKNLSALIVPNHTLILEYAKTINKPTLTIKQLCNEIEINNLIRKELYNQTIHLSQFEKINNFILLAKPFEIGKELTQTLKLKRFYIQNTYKTAIASITKK